MRKLTWLIECSWLHAALSTLLMIVMLPVPATPAETVIMYWVIYLAHREWLRGPIRRPRSHRREAWDLYGYRPGSNPAATRDRPKPPTNPPRRP